MATQETYTVGAIKAAALNTLAGISNTSGDLPNYMQYTLWGLTGAYTLLQIIKAAPWLTMQTYAFWCGIRYGDWGNWRKLAKWEEEPSDKGEVE